MAGIRWKEGAVCSIETRAGLHVLAQMLNSPYMMFFNKFQSSDQWDDVTLHESDALFCVGVVRQFTSQSIIKKQKIDPVVFQLLPTHWIASHNDFFTTALWAGTPNERTTSFFGPGGQLVFKDITAVGMINDKVVMPEISYDDDGTIDGHELTNLRMFPELNERLYLCHLLQRKIDPLKEMVFKREMPIECCRYVDLMNWRKAPKDAIVWEDYSLTVEEAELGKRIKK